MQQFNEFSTKMNTIFINSKNSETSDPHRLSLNHTDKMDLRRKSKDIALWVLSNYYAWKKCPIGIVNWKYQLQHGMKNLNYLKDHILSQTLLFIYKVIFNIYFKKYGEKSMDLTL